MSGAGAGERRAAPVRRPGAPSLPRLASAPSGAAGRYRPKWDGFRCLAFVRDGEVELQSRHGRPFTRYFPEIAAALSGRPDAVLDGELVVRGPAGFDFAALMLRLHPAASRVAALVRETPATFVAFDLLATGDEDLRARPFVQRRQRLEALLAPAPDGVRLTPATRDRATAERWLERYASAGIDGVVVKADDMPYVPGARRMLKVKQERTADCVVAGFRLFLDRPALASLMLGLYGEGGLEHVGVATGFPEPQRRELAHELSRLAVPLEQHPWAEGFLLEGGPTGRLKGAAGRWTPGMTLDWVPIRPERVCEVAYDQLDGRRLRHPARFRRWRPDRDAVSCRFDQLDSSPPPIAELLPLV